MGIIALSFKMCIDIFTTHKNLFLLVSIFLISSLDNKSLYSFVAQLGGGYDFSSTVKNMTDGNLFCKLARLLEDVNVDCIILSLWHSMVYQPVIIVVLRCWKRGENNKKLIKRFEDD